VKYSYYEGTRALQHARAFAQQYKMFSYSRETALQGALVLAKSGTLELGDYILRTL